MNNRKVLKFINSINFIKLYFIKINKTRVPVVLSSIYVYNCASGNALHTSQVNENSFSL